jgi:transposase
MVVAEGHGLPVGVAVYSASPHEIKLAEDTLEKTDRRFRKKIQRLIADKAYDSDPFRKRQRSKGIEVIAPHKENRVKEATQDGRALRRYRRRWKIERTNAWWQNYRRLVVRWERKPEMYLAFLHIACLLIVFRHL